MAVRSAVGWCTRPDMTTGRRPRGACPRTSGGPSQGRSAYPTRLLLQSYRRAQLVRPVGVLPRQVDVGAAEVTVRGGRRVDRAQQVEVADDRAGSQIEDLGDGRG